MSNPTDSHTGEIQEKQRPVEMPPAEMLFDLAELFKMFGDSTRVSILYALFAKTMCVQELAELLHMGQSAVSHQLRLLRTARLVRGRKQGKQVYYSLEDEHIHRIFDQGLEHISEQI